MERRTIRAICIPLPYPSRSIKPARCNSASSCEQRCAARQPGACFRLGVAFLDPTDSRSNGYFFRVYGSGLYLDGMLLARWGGGLHPTAPGDFYAPHDIALDSHGDLYVSEVVWSAGARLGHVDPTCHSLQKFVRRSG